MMARSSPNRPFVAGAAIEGVNATLRAYSKLGKEARAATKDEVMKVAEIVGKKTAAAGRARGGRDALVAGTMKVRRDRVPIVEYGGKRRSGVSGGATFNQLVYGMEFGSIGMGARATDRASGRPSNNTPGWRFPARTARKGRTGNVGYWIFPTASTMGPEIADLWLKALDKIAKEWGDG
jgi:hypothetical protein